MMEEDQVTATYPCFWTIMSDLVDHPDFETTDLSRVKLMNLRRYLRHDRNGRYGHDQPL